MQNSANLQTDLKLQTTNLWIIDTGKEGLSLYFSLCEDVTFPCTEPGHKRCGLFEAFNSCVGTICSN